MQRVESRMNCRRRACVRAPINVKPECAYRTPFPRRVERMFEAIDFHSRMIHE